jgi:hypothetical protein
MGASQVEKFGIRFSWGTAATAVLLESMSVSFGGVLGEICEEAVG